MDHINKGGDLSEKVTRGIRLGDADRHSDRCWVDLLTLNRVQITSKDTRYLPGRIFDLPTNNTGMVPDLRKIVVFGSTCSLYRDPSKHALKQRAQLATIVGINEETRFICTRRTR